MGVDGSPLVVEGTRDILIEVDNLVEEGSLARDNVTVAGSSFLVVVDSLAGADSQGIAYEEDIVVVGSQAAVVDSCYSSTLIKF